jgi:ATP-binding cassette subfamily F protein uup
LATRIVELDRGILRSYEGNYSRYLDLKHSNWKLKKNKMPCLRRNWQKKKHGFVKALKHVVPVMKAVFVPKSFA